MRAARFSLFPALIICIFSAITCSLNAQSWGYSAGLHTFRPIYQNDVRTEYPDMVSPTFFGLHGEFLFFSHGLGFPYLSYASLGVSIDFTHTDTTTIVTEEIDRWWNEKLFPGTAKRNYKAYNLLVAYEFPQDWNDFLTINYGGGMELAFSKTKYDAPEMDNSVYKITGETGPMQDEMDNWDPLNNQTKHCSPRGALFVGVFYEFEKFFLTAKYSILLSDRKFIGAHIGQSLVAGIYIPISEW